MQRAFADLAEEDRLRFGELEDDAALAGEELLAGPATRTLSTCSEGSTSETSTPLTGSRPDSRMPSSPADSVPT